MDEAMVTGRMSAEKKAAGAEVLARSGMNASQAVNMLYDRLVEEQDASFLERHEVEPREWESAARLIDSIPSAVPISTRFDNMTRGEIKLARAKARGVI